MTEPKETKPAFYISEPKVVGLIACVVAGLAYIVAAQNDHETRGRIVGVFVFAAIFLAYVFPNRVRDWAVRKGLLRD